MTGSDLLPARLSDELDVLAARLVAAEGTSIRLLNYIGGRAENMLEHLPDWAKDELERATERALGYAVEAAQVSRGRLRDQPAWVNTGFTTVLGAAGGSGGLPTALAELPVTTTVLFRAILGIAAAHGFDPGKPEVRREGLTVFSAAGPLEYDDGANTGFLATRVTLSGSTVRSVIARVAPRLSIVLGQKLAAQTVPVLGAAAGAATNYAYTRYYQQMAHVHFGLARLAREGGHDTAVLTEALRARLPRRV
ncbi:MAG: EcsC family protein [Rhodosalinus sp.]|uniref:EcsC family protein n=1 Tax=Rhodosalinus sp. TaxID=2047741 RepID=UPI00397CEED1